MKWIELRRSKIKVFGKKSGLMMKGMTAPEEHTHFLQGLLTNDIKSLREGSFNYNLWLKHNGAPVGDFFVYRFSDYYLLDTEEDAGKVIEEFNRLKLSLRVFFEDLSDSMSHRLVFGKGAREFVEGITGTEAPREFEFLYRGDILVANNPLRLREECYEIIGNLRGVNMAGEEVSQEELEGLRIRRCIPRIHKELREGFSPLEAGVLEYAISLTKGCYVGQEAIARVHFRGRTPRVLARFELRGEVSEGDKLLEEGKAVGIITSKSPVDNSALGYVLRAKAQEGKEFISDSGTATLIRVCS
jgi:folate-binding protein YgfZ